MTKVAMYTLSNLIPTFLSVKDQNHTPCIAQSQKWEKESVNEGSFVVKHGDTYYMTYSGNGYTNPEYGLGVATAKSPAGPWVKYENNPIFQFPETKSYGRLEGVGHSAMFIDKNGDMRIVFHAHKSPGVVHRVKCTSQLSNLPKAMNHRWSFHRTT